MSCDAGVLCVVCVLQTLDGIVLPGSPKVPWVSPISGSHTSSDLSEDLPTDPRSLREKLESNLTQLRHMRRRSDKVGTGGAEWVGGWL